jgi:adenylosuccinate lyase
MIDRYSYPEMRAIWEPQNKYRKWLDVELLACEAHAELGKIPPEALEIIRERADFSVERIDEIEEEVHHDVIAFLTSVAEYVGPESRYIHYGMTSSDVLDTAMSVLMVEALDLIIADVAKLTDILKSQAIRYRDLVMMGRTHGIHAEPITLGLKLAGWAFEMHRNRERLKQAREVIAFGKISGAVGTYAHVDPFVEEYVCQKLGLKPAPVSTQVLQRDRHAEYLSSLAITGSSLEKFATEIRSLQRTEILELEEPFARGQKGSSAMPHKRNPILMERISGQARVLRGNLLAALENMPLWNERDISHSSVERVIVPDSTILLDYMLRKFTGVVENLQVHPQNMQRNFDLTQGLPFSQRVLLTLVEKGASREDSYRMVQRSAMSTWRGEGSFKDLILQDEEVLDLLSPEELEALFDVRSYLRHLDTIFARLENL